MLLALAQFVLLSHQDNTVEIDVQDASVVYVAEADPVPEAVPEKVFLSNLEATSLEEYQALVKQSAIFPTHLANPIDHVALAEQFAYELLLAPHITRVTEEQFRQSAMANCDAMAYLKAPTQAHPSFWMVCAINTPYGHIYLSTALNDEGVVPTNTNGVFVSYDSDSTKLVLYGVAEAYAERFNGASFALSDTIQSESELLFLLGDAKHPFTIANYL